MIRDRTRTVRNEVLATHHDVSRFDCGSESLNLFLRRHALNAPQQGLSQTWVTVTTAGEVWGYHTLAIATVTKFVATPRVAKGMPNYDIPCVLLARLAVHHSVRSQGLGGMILETAMRKAVALGRRPIMTDETPGLPVRALLVHALDVEAAAFYRHHGFEPSPTDALHLLMLLKDVEASLRDA